MIKYGNDLMAIVEDIASANKITFIQILLFFNQSQEQSQVLIISNKN